MQSIAVNSKSRLGRGAATCNPFPSKYAYKINSSMWAHAESIGPCIEPPKLGQMPEPGTQHRTHNTLFLQCIIDRATGSLSLHVLQDDGRATGSLPTQTRHMLRMYTRTHACTPTYASYHYPYVLIRIRVVIIVFSMGGDRPRPFFIRTETTSSPSAAKIRWPYDGVRMRLQVGLNVQLRLRLGF